MTEKTRPEEAPQFETDTVDANLAAEQGLGLGARELEAQREPGDSAEAELDRDDEAALERNTAVQGQQSPATEA